MSTIWLPDLAKFEGPKYRRLTEALRRAVRDGSLPAGEKLPPVRDLAWRLDMTPGTVARAYTILTDEGVLKAAVGRGTFVAEPRPEREVVPPIVVDPNPHGVDTSDGPLSLYSPGLPNVGQSRLIRDILAEIAAEPPSGVMHYPQQGSNAPARLAALNWLAGTPLGVVDEEDIVLAHGGQNAILLVMQAVLRGPRPVVYVEELCYQGFRRAAELSRAQIVMLPMDGQGIVPDTFAAAVAQHGPGLLCTSPEVHNPTGILTPEARRREIAAIAKRSDVQILEDDCYRLGAPRAPSYRMLAPERSWYVTSVSKSISPALRLGFAIAPHGRVAPLRRAAEHSFFGLSTILFDLAAKLLTHPQLPALQDAVLRAYASRVQIAVNHLGGYDLNWRDDVAFLWLRLPEGWRSGPFCVAAEARGVSIRPSDQFTDRDSRAPHAVRISINAQVAAERFEAGMSALRDLLDNPPADIGV
ncbi:PLP-dependent aminotransferase family protein [Aliishimia ponticola]|uniref:PLP-dependent aminotransferase family protein n=1 Tax=Aliishimia ponticola TaxID=2499833 RepID=A0A4S4NI77_9RHOB|nr:PLP-dependent aminotransferase family protein [Aliishimia ponticola]THH38407.1 PLP-dependent aminotransferase family protein [Aliishimia ponticola]